MAALSMLSPDIATPEHFQVLQAAGWDPAMSVGVCIVTAESGFRNIAVLDPTRNDPVASAWGWFQLNNGTDALGVTPGFGVKAITGPDVLDPLTNATYAWNLFKGRYTLLLAN